VTIVSAQMSSSRTARSDRDLLWGLFVEGQHIGSTGIHQIDWRNRHAQTGIVIGDRTWWGRGIATRSHALRTRYAFEELNLEKLVITVIEGNIASRRALERAGYESACFVTTYIAMGAGTMPGLASCCATTGNVVCRRRKETHQS
jgi:RimJ/RimL family protein N-acetyltransferase